MKCVERLLHYLLVEEVQKHGTNGKDEGRRIILSGSQR